MEVSRIKILSDFIKEDYSSVIDFIEEKMNWSVNESISINDSEINVFSGVSTKENIKILQENTDFLYNGLLIIAIDFNNNVYDKQIVLGLFYHNSIGEYIKLNTSLYPEIFYKKKILKSV